MTEDEMLQIAADAQRAAFLEGFKNYGMLLQSMSPEEWANEIGKHFPNPHQAAILTVLAAMLLGRHNAKESC